MKTLLSIFLFSLVFTPVISAQYFGDWQFVQLDGTPHDVIYDDLRNVAYVSNRTLGKIDIVSLDTLNVTGSISVGNTPTGMTLTPDGDKLLVTLYTHTSFS